MHTGKEKGNKEMITRAEYLEKFEETLRYEKSLIVANTVNPLADSTPKSIKIQTYLRQISSYLKSDNYFNAGECFIRISIYAKALSFQLMAPSEQKIDMNGFQDYFVQLSEKEFELTKAKNADYTGGSEDSFANFKLVAELGICSLLRGIIVRQSDKASRTDSYLKKGSFKVKDEGIADTLMDQAVYSKIGYIGCHGLMDGRL